MPKRLTNAQLLADAAKEAAAWQARLRAGKTRGDRARAVCGRPGAPGREVRALAELPESVAVALHRELYGEPEQSR